MAGPIKKAFAQLSAAGNTAALPVPGVKNHAFAIKVANIDTTVVVRAEGSEDGTNFFNLDDSGADTTYTANGTYPLNKPNFTCLQVRLVFVSETGGAAVTLDVTYRGERK